MWTYTDIYKAIIKYIDTDLQNTDYILNFGVVAIATQSPQAPVKFCLMNVQIKKNGGRFFSLEKPSWLWRLM